MKYKKYYLIIVILFILIFSFHFIHKDATSNIDKTNNSGIDNRQAGNTVSYGMKNSKGIIINEGSKIKPENNMIKTTLSLDHYIDENREYGLIVMSDFKQVPFIVEGKQKTSKYFFEMPKHTSRDIKISLPIHSNTHEIMFLLIKKPNYKLKEMDFIRAGILQEVIGMRFSIKENGIDNIKEIKPNNIVQDDLDESLFITSNKKKLQSVFVEKEGKKLTLSVGNENEESIGYAVVAFKDWEQLEIFNNQDIVYTTVAPGSRQLFDFQLPDVNQESNFLFISFPFPYEVQEDNYVSQQAIASFRTVIQDEE